MDSAANLLPFIQYSKPDYAVAPHHRQVCEALEAVERRDIDRLAIFMPPRHGKSEIASRRFPAWYLGRNPDKQIVCASYNSELASDFGRAVRNTVSSPEYRAVFDTKLAQDSQAADRWHTDKGGVYVAVGIGGTLTGRGADVALVDDPVKDAQDAQSETIRDKTWDWYTSVLRTRLMPRGAIVLIQTRWHEDDLAGRILNGKEANRWKVISLPALKDGQALWPEAYPVAELESIRDLDPLRFSALYQQQPVPAEGSFFKREWAKFYKEPPSSLHKYSSSDFAVTEGGGDWTEIWTHGVDPAGDLYLGLDAYSGQTTADVWIEQMVAQFKRHKPFAHFGESGVIRRAIEPVLIRRMHETGTFTRLEWITRTRDKAATARALQARMAMGKVYLPDNEHGHRLLTQMLAFPAGMHDDAVDAAALMALALDQAHPATQGVVTPIRKPDRWDRVFENDLEVDSWKTA